MAEPRFPCAACGYQVHSRRAGSGERCPVCGWIDDFEQLVHPDLTYGANAGVTLRQAQAAAAGAGSHALEPRVQFTLDPKWRPLRAGEVPPADPAGLSSPVCYIATPDPEGYRPYWLRRG